MIGIFKKIFGEKKSDSENKNGFNTDLLFKDGKNKGEEIIENTKSEIDKTLNNEKTIDLTKSEATKISLDKNEKESLYFDVLDLSDVIDTFADIKAVEGFEKEMRESKNGNLFNKIGGFFKRSFQRMGREAWIDSQKKKYISEIEEGLIKGTYTEETLRNHVISADKGIEYNAYLSHEEVLSNEQTPVDIQKAIDDWLNADKSIDNERKSKLTELKFVIENNYPKITTDLTQLEQSLIRLEKAKIKNELETIEAKLNILDIGYIEDGYGQRQKGAVVKMLDGFNNTVNNSKLPDWFKKYIGGLAQNPNTAAVLSALTTRSVIGAIVGTSLISGFLAPVAVGALAGGVLAAGRARREMIDRSAQIDRRGALGYKTGDKLTDGESKNTTHNTTNYQHSTMDLYNKIYALSVANVNNSNYDIIKNEALTSGIYYLVKHRVGHETKLNMLQYDADKSVSSQHVETIILLNKLFPNLVSKFNSGELFDESNNSQEAVLTREKYSYIQNITNSTIAEREKQEKDYATKQGIIYGAIATGVGGTISGILNYYQPNDGHYEILANSKSSYADNLEEYTDVKRDFWYDNNTVKFDKTELMIHADKSGGWNISNIIGKNPFTNGHNINHVSGSDFTSNKLQAVITPKIGGPSFVLPIDENGNIQIPKSMQSAFDTRSFAFLEVGEVEIKSNGAINLDPIATLKGSGSMLFEKQVGEDLKQFITDDNDWLGIPFGWNKYHEIGELTKREEAGQFIKQDKPKTKYEENENVINNESPNMAELLGIGKGEYPYKGKGSPNKKQKKVEEKLITDATEIKENIENNTIDCDLENKDNIIQNTGEDTEIKKEKLKETKPKNNDTLLAINKPEQNNILQKSTEKLVREFTQAFTNGLVQTFKIEKYKDGTVDVFLKKYNGEYEIATELNGGIPKGTYSRESFETRIKNELASMKETDEAKKFFVAEPTKIQVGEFTQAFENGFVNTYRIEKSKNGEVKILVKNSDGNFEKATEENRGIPKGKYSRDNFNERIKNEIIKIN